MRARQSPNILATACISGAAALVVFSVTGALQAESVSRSDAQTPGEKRLLDWDLKKSYDLSRSRTNSKEQAPSRAFSTQSFRPGGFTTKAFSTEAFTSPEFLAPEGKNQAKPFATKPADLVSSKAFGKPFLTAKSAGTPPKVVPTFPTSASGVPKEFGEAARPFQGPEAARKEQKYVPGNAPNGGVIEGRRLSSDEVREILNKSKYPRLRDTSPPPPKASVSGIC